MTDDVVPKYMQYIENQTGKFYIPIDDINGGCSVLGAMKQGEMFEGNVVNYCAQHIKPGTTVVDAGANWGQMTIAFARMVGETGEVHSIEASDYVVKHLKLTLAANADCKNVVLHHRAGWHTSGQELQMLIPHAGIPYSGAGVRGSVDGRDNTSHAVQSLAIDDIEFKTPVSVIKIDAQGSDLFILMGAKKTLEKYQPIVVMEYETWYESAFEIQRQQLIDFLDSINYTEIGSIENNQHDLIFWPKDRWIINSK